MRKNQVCKNVLLIDDFLDQNEAQQLFKTLKASLNWQREQLLIFGKRQWSPRLVAWHGDSHCCYRYSGINHEPQPWTTELSALRLRVENFCDAQFNSVLGNLYRDGGDYMGWHCDDEPTLGKNPIIASISLGATRRFQIRNKRDHHNRFTLELEHGSLLIMSGALQHSHQHRIAPTKRPIEERINLTFRKILLSRSR